MRGSGKGFLLTPLPTIPPSSLSPFSTYMLLLPTHIPSFPTTRVEGEEEGEGRMGWGW